MAVANTPDDSDLQVKSNEDVLQWDATDKLASIEAPTLILVARDSMITTQSQVRHAAASVKDTRLVAIAGSWAPYFSDATETFEALGDFLSWSDEGPDWVPLPAGVSTVVFTDLVASTEFIDRDGDAAARDAVRIVEQTVTSAANDHHGRVVKHLGDGTLLEFESASDALNFAQQAQRELAEAEHGLRIGMAAGEPIREDGDVHGAVVVLASRVTDLAGAGQILVTDGVRQLVLGKSFEFTSEGTHVVKGFDQPVGIWLLES